MTGIEEVHPMAKISKGKTTDAGYKWDFESKKSRWVNVEGEFHRIQRILTDKLCIKK